MTHSESTDAIMAFPPRRGHPYHRAQQRGDSAFTQTKMTGASSSLHFYRGLAVERAWRIFSGGLRGPTGPAQISGLFQTEWWSTRNSAVSPRLTVGGHVRQPHQRATLAGGGAQNAASRRYQNQRTTVGLDLSRSKKTSPFEYPHGLIRWPGHCCLCTVPLVLILDLSTKYFFLCWVHTSWSHCLARFQIIRRNSQIVLGSVRHFIWSLSRWPCDMEIIRLSGVQIWMYAMGITSSHPWAHLPVCATDFCYFTTHTLKFIVLHNVLGVRFSSRLKAKPSRREVMWSSWGVLCLRCKLYISNVNIVSLQA